VPLCPGASPFVRLVNSGVTPDPNVELIARVFKLPPSRDVVVNGLVRGRIIDEPVSLMQAAGLLDELRYDHYRPTADGWEGRRWKDLVAKVGIAEGADFEGLLPFFRPPDVDMNEATPYARGGPYAISAYLRLWKACLTRHARGLVSTDDWRVPWSIVDLTRKEAQQPRFYVGIRYGSGDPVTKGPLAELAFTVRAMKRSSVNGELEAGWGSRNPTDGEGRYFGDEFFDYHFHGRPVPTASPGESVWRPPGEPGLILFHVTEQPGRVHPTVAVGVALPIGGPDQFAARSSAPAEAAQ